MRKAIVSVAATLAVWGITSATAAEEAQCSRNADDIKAAVVIQKENGEFCAGTAQTLEEQSSPHSGTDPVEGGGKFTSRMSDADFQKMRNEGIRQTIASCIDFGAPAAYCRQTAGMAMDRSLMRYYQKCTQEKKDVARCDADLMIAMKVSAY
jgi:hypothetical protein